MILKCQLPLHTNCTCSLVEISKNEYEEFQSFEFGNTNHEQWDNKSEEEKYLWCNSFRDHFGDAIDKYAEKYGVPKELLAGIIANEMLDWKFPDGTFIDGLGGGGVGYAQISVQTAKQYGITGSTSEIRARLNSYEGSVEIAAKILKNYFDEFCQSAQNGKSGSGFQKSTLYYMAKPNILQREDLVNMKVPEWLLNSMSAVWNSGIEVIYAKDPLGDDNYRNAYIHGVNSWYIFKYLPKLVNE